MLGAAHIHLRDALRLIASRADVEVVTVYEADRARGQRWAAAAGASLAPTPGDALERADVCMIYSEPSHHLELVRLAGMHGRPAFIEKPLALDPAVAEALARVAPQHSTMGYFLRHGRALRRLRALLRSGDLGEVPHIALTFVHNGLAQGWFDDEYAWMRSSAEGGGGFFDLVTHCVDTAAWMLGSTLTVDRCKLTSEHHGTAELATRTTRISVEAGWEAPAPRIEVTVTGTRHAAAARDGVATLDRHAILTGPPPTAADALVPWLKHVRDRSGEITSLDDGVANVHIASQLRSAARNLKRPGFGGGSGS